MATGYTIIEKHAGTGAFTGATWHAQVSVRDPRFPTTPPRLLRVGLERGNPARGMYGVKGFHWFGYVRDERGGTIWHERVEKSAGVRLMLRCAGLLPWPAPRAADARDAATATGMYDHDDVN